MNKPPKRLLDQVRDQIRLRYYSIRTEQAYVSWIKRYILFHGKKHPKDLDKAEIEAFLTYLAKGRNVSPPRKIKLSTFYCFYTTKY
jgi:hypothetical protein